MPPAVRPAAWLLLAVIALAGCAQPPHGTASFGPGSAPRQSPPLTRWDRFPVAQQPRPILLGPGQQVPAVRNGFHTLAAKLAFDCWGVDLPTTGLPPVPAAALVRWPDGTTGRYRAAPLTEVHARTRTHDPASGASDCRSPAACG